MIIFLFVLLKFLFLLIVNINELCNNIYSKDLSFRLKLKNFIKKEIDIRKNKINNNSEELILQYL